MFVSMISLDIFLKRRVKDKGHISNSSPHRWVIGTYNSFALAHRHVSFPSIPSLKTNQSVENACVTFVKEVGERNKFFEKINDQ